MILDENVKVKIGGKNIKYFRTLYPDIKMLQEIIIPITLLSNSSNVKINCKCDICHKERHITYQKYKESEKLYGEYSCQKCSHNKRRITNIEKYGVENYVETKEFENKSKITINKKYGCDNTFQNEKIKEKIKNTILEKYGADHISKTEHFKNSNIKSCLNKYNVEYYYQSLDFKLKSDNTKLKLYNDIYYSNREKAKNTRIKNGNMISDENLNNWKLYKRLVWKLTHRNKKQLFKNWTGYDFYDNEYIMENLSLNKYDKNYPTVDHKISVKYGFDNNILPMIISDINNLCITKRIINCKKSFNNSL
jgi:hypothetical protein